MARRRRPPRPGALADLSPLRIAKQIALLQLAYYVSAFILLTFTALVAGKPASLDRLVSWHYLRGDTTEGWMFGLDWMLASLTCVVALLLLIARSKLVLDFALTIHLLHLIATALYTRSLPTHVFWWLLQAASAALMTVLGIWSCRWRELRPIAFGALLGGGRDDGAASGAALEDGLGDEEDGAGFARGRGKGAGRDGAGDYEMVPVKDSDGRGG